MHRFCLRPEQQVQTPARGLAYHSTMYTDVRTPSALGASTGHCPTGTPCWHCLPHQHRSLSKFFGGINVQERIALPVPPLPRCQCELTPAGESLVHPALGTKKERDQVAIWSPASVPGAFKRKGRSPEKTTAFCLSCYRKCENKVRPTLEDIQVFTWEQSLFCP